MPSSDSTLQALPELTTPDLLDLLLIADTSDSYNPKKTKVSTLISYFCNNNNVFNISSGKLKLLNSLDANSTKITKLAQGTEDDDGVNYGQVKEAIMSLSSLSLNTPTATDIGVAIRIRVDPVLNPWGGFYMFYWCVDTQANTVLTLSGGNVTASSGADVFFEGSIAQIVTVVKNAGWTGKKFHFAVFYRNIKHSTPLSPTGHLTISSASATDMLAALPVKVNNMSLSNDNNRLYIRAEIDPGTAPGSIYILQLLFDDKEDTAIQGTEEGLITAASAYPFFTYDIPLTMGKYTYAHCRIITVNLMGQADTCDTVHSPLVIDLTIISDNLVNYLADRLAEKLITRDGTPIERR